MKYLYFNKYWEINEEYNLDKLLYLMIDRPNKTGFLFKEDLCWLYKDRIFHRNYDLPCFVGCYNDLHWNKKGIMYREKFKPAIIYHNGDKQYWLNDKQYKS